MPKLPVNYQKTIIYKIVSRRPELSDWKHLDHTTDLVKRKNYIKTSVKNGKDNILFNFINDNGGWDAFDILMLGAFPTTNSELIKTHIYGLVHPAILI
jgi:hypothetical protein